MPEIEKLVCVSLCTTVTVADDMPEEEILKAAQPGLIQNLYQGGVDNIDYIATATPDQPANIFASIVNPENRLFSPTGDISNQQGVNNTGFLIVCQGGIVQDVYSRTPVRYVLVDYSNIDYSQPLDANDVEDGGPFDGVRYASLIEGSMVKVFSDNISGINAHPSVHQFLAAKMEEIGF